MSEQYSTLPKELTEDQKRLMASHLQDSVRWNYGVIDSKLGTFAVRKIRNTDPFDNLVFPLWSNRLMGDDYKDARFMVAPEGNIELYSQKGTEVIDVGDVRFVDQKNSGPGYMTPEGYVLLNQAYHLGGARYSIQEMAKLLEMYESGDELNIWSDQQFLQIGPDLSRVGDRIWLHSLFVPGDTDYYSAVAIKHGELLTSRSVAPFAWSVQSESLLPCGVTIRRRRFGNRRIGY